ncbi:hypothetical protein KBY58_10970 [Cyanobium sp. HWJ4-Hawea]|uniref:hypothetical protein n=1 Tax=Cyanobium sp. HWJ4-Hawea TaxID=2823713 RepID=UPI0020CCB49D|nr:hypothetical protein [Cyanobium sp. HWJ4-Hawea]MCP9809956.1 hypothetical protein [Cyanobium sp. HWJ4-Hawea]
MAANSAVDAKKPATALPTTKQSEKSKSAKKINSLINCFPIAAIGVDPLAPPIAAPGQPLKVDVDLHVDQIPKIEPNENYFILDAFLDANWCDPRLAKELLPGEAERVYANDEAHDFLKTHWDPQITFINELGATEGDDFNLAIFSNGRAELTRRLQVKLASNFDLHRFPFDKQKLVAKISSFAWDSDILRFVDDGENLSVSKDFDITEWDITRFESRVFDYDDPDHGNDIFSMLRLEVDVSRKSDFYLYKIFIPLAVLSFTSIFFLAIPIDAIGDRIAFVSSLLFTTLAYQLIIATSIPRVPYFTIGDQYTLFLFFFMMAELFIGYFISLVNRFGGESKLLVNRVEMGFEIGLPLVFVLANVFFYVHAVG